MQKPLPLISCIMPTRNRRAFLRQAIAYFEAQDYPNKELIIVEDGDECNFDLASRHKYYCLSNDKSIGEKRNFACSVANGDIFCHMDDDDWFGETRLTTQIAPLLTGDATVSALKMSLLYSIPTQRLWTCSPEAHKELFAHDVRCGTLMYWSSYWQDGLRYEDSSRGEDVSFLNLLLETCATLAPIIDPASYICIRHGGNVTDDLHYTSDPGWQQVDATKYLPMDALAFYRELDNRLLRLSLLPLAQEVQQ